MGGRGAAVAPGSLPPGHVVRVFYEEHEQILRVLDRIELLVARVLSCGSLAEAVPHGNALHEVARTLQGAEPHHAREEQVLFPRLEALGIAGPPQRMRFEHEELRALKGRLAELARALASGLVADLASFRRGLEGVSQALLGMLRDHIAKENEILYPVALDAIAPQEWEVMKREADRIGYCAFPLPRD